LALVEEALQAKSTEDFIHKLSKTNNEANETRFWINLIKETDFIHAEEANSLI